MMLNRKGRHTTAAQQIGREASGRRRNGRVPKVVAALAAGAALAASAVAAAPAEARQNEGTRITCYNLGDGITQCVCVTNGVGSWC
jgi:hypothetical protein